MADLNVRSDSVDVEQIMKQIRTRIREKRGSDYTETELQRLASAKLEQFADPSALRHDLLEQFRKRGDEPSTYHRHRGIRRLLLWMVHPLLKRVQKQLMADLNLYFEIIHNLVVEVTKLGVENHNLKMKVESLSSRLDFDERRARSLEGVVQYKQRPQGPGPRQDSDRLERDSRGGPRQDSGRPDREPRNGGSGHRQDSGRPERESRDGARGPSGGGSGTPAVTGGASQATAPPQQSAAPSNGPSGQSTGTSPSGPSSGTSPSGPSGGTSPSGPSQSQGDGERRRRRRRRRRRPGSTLADSPNAANTPQGAGGAPTPNQNSAGMAGDADDGDDGDEGAGNQ